jgi:hypothetical protein
MSHFLLMRFGFIYLIMSASKTAAFGQQVIHMRSRIHHYMIRRLVHGAPRNEIG